MIDPEAICPHCGHKWGMHRDMQCYLCREFHTVCGVCMDFYICFTEIKEGVEWEEEEGDTKVSNVQVAP